MTVSWDQRCIAYSMLLSGSSAQETARRFRVNTGAVVEWARLAGMVIRMGARGGIEPVDDSESVTRRPRAYRRLTREDRIFIEMGGQQHADMVGSCDCEASGGRSLNSVSGTPSASDRNGARSWRDARVQVSRGHRAPSLDEASTGMPFGQARAAWAPCSCCRGAE